MNTGEAIALLADRLRNAGRGAGGAAMTGREEICGRILFGTSEDAFTHLSGVGQPFPFVIGPESLAGFCDAASHMEMMFAIGFEEEWVRRKLESGNTFKLVLFPASACGGMVSPTWDALMNLIERESAECAEKLRPHLQTIRSTPYSELTEKIGYDVNDLSAEQVDKVGTFEAYAAASTPGDLGHARAFLRHTLKCTPLFRGDGFAYSDDGTRGVREYLVKRLPVEALPGAQWVILQP